MTIDRDKIAKRREQRMRVDLRYVIVLLAFYAPGLLMYIGSLMLGFTLEESRSAIAVIGSLFGFIEVSLMIQLLFSSRGKPIWFCI